MFFCRLDSDGKLPCPPALRRCPPSKYRSEDGACNNVRHPEWGTRGSPYRRLLLPSYIDGELLFRYNSLAYAWTGNSVCAAGQELSPVIGIKAHIHLQSSDNKVDKNSRKILEKKWEYSEGMDQLFLDYKNFYDSVKREGLYNLMCG